MATGKMSVAGLKLLGRQTMTILDIRDELAAAKNLAAAVYMASDARSMPGDQRAALCELSNLVVERLKAIVLALDHIIAKDAGRGGEGAG